MVFEVARELRRRARADQRARRRSRSSSIDSLDLAELSQIVHERFGVELRGSDVAEVKTVGDAIKLIAGAPLSDGAVVVTGVGAVTPLGVGARDAARALERGRVRHPRRRGRAARTSTPRDFLSVKEARRADRFTQLAIAACAEALADAGWEGEPPYDAATRRVRARHRHRRHRDAARRPRRAARQRARRRVSPLAVPLMMSNAGAAALSMRHGLRGPVAGGQHRLRVGRARDRLRARHDPARRSRRGRRRRLGGEPDAARAGGVLGARRDVAERHLAARSTRAATAS